MGLGWQPSVSLRGSQQNSFEDELVASVGAEDHLAAERGPRVAAELGRGLLRVALFGVWFEGKPKGLDAFWGGLSSLRQT